MRLIAEHHGTIKVRPDQKIVVADQLTRVMQCYDGRDVETARDDSGVGSQSAQVGEECSKAVLFVLDYIGGA